jgi:xanthine dehydrogenase accessory factor
MPSLLLIRGGGDLASGVALRLYRAGLRIVITEVAQPLAVRRLACFAEAVYRGQFTVEGVTARCLPDPADTLSILMTLSKGQIPLVVDPEAEAITHLHPTVVVDARMLKHPIELDPRRVALLIGLGPGFEAGVNCHAVVETRRGHTLGRVLWQGKTEPDSGIPDSICGIAEARVLRAPADGVFQSRAEIGAHVEAGQSVASVAGQDILAPVSGVLRGLLYPGLTVTQSLKVGDIDPRDDPRYCSMVSDKALAVGGGVLEAILTRPHLRAHLWT